jgi:hypothetical protein
MSPDEDVFLPSRKVRERYGNVSDMWLHRRLRDDASFPRPTYISTRRFWRLGDLVEWERALASRPRKPAVEVAA